MIRARTLEEKGATENANINVRAKNQIKIAEMEQAKATRTEQINSTLRRAE